MGNFGDVMVLDVQKGDKRWSKELKPEDFNYSDIDDIDVIFKKYGSVRNANNVRMYVHDIYPDSYPLLIDVYPEFRFLLPRYGDNRNFDFLYSENGEPPNDFDQSPEHKEEEKEIEFIPKYTKKTELNFREKGWDSNGDEIKIDYKTENCRWTKTYYSNQWNVDKLNVKQIYSEINAAKKAKSFKIYAHDDYPEKFPLL